MMLRKKQHFFTPANLNPGGSALLGSVVKNEIDNSFPVEEVLISVSIVCGATGPTLVGIDNLLGILKRVTINVNDNNAPRNIVDCRGVMLLDYVEKAGFNLDADTLGAVALCQGQASVSANMAFRINYRIPLVHPAIGEPLRSRCLQPFHTWNNKPQITLEFESGANMFSAGSLAFVSAEYVLLRRNMPTDVTNEIMADGGFIPMDLLEAIFPVAVGVAGEQRFKLPTPGSYLNLLISQYLGGASLTRQVLDQSGIGTQVVNGFGSESRWRLESGGVVDYEWRAKHLRCINGFSMPKNSITQTSSPAMGGSVAAATNFQPASSIMLDFLDDGVPGGSVNELGSVLDLNIPLRSGLQMDLVGPVASVATNASSLNILGHRLYGDLQKFQAAKVR